MVGWGGVAPLIAAPGPAASYFPPSLSLLPWPFLALSLCSFISSLLSLCQTLSICPIMPVCLTSSLSILLCLFI